MIAKPPSDKAFANSTGPDETAHDEPSHQELRCLSFRLSTSQKKKKKKKKKKNHRRHLSSEIWHQKVKSFGVRFQTTFVVFFFFFFFFFLLLLLFFFRFFFLN